MLNKEFNLFKLHQVLKDKKYIHSNYKKFTICDPKKRVINKAIVVDRVLHHAIVRILQTIYEKKFIYDSYSSRKNKGTLKAIERFEKFARKLSQNNTRTVWVLKCDIKKFFDSVDHRILISIISKNIYDNETLELLETIINSFSVNTDKGIPLGNYTSQLFSNIYLDSLDQYIKRELRIKYYIRYADDFFILDGNRENLEFYFNNISKFLNSSLKLEINKTKIFFKKWHSGVDILGYLSFPYFRLLRTKTKKRIFRKSKQAVIEDKVKFYESSLQSYFGILKHCNSNKIMKIILTFYYSLDK